MCKKDLFNRILDIVSSETEVNVEAIINTKNKTLEVVDARFLLVYFLNREGYNIPYISKNLHITNQCANYIIRNFDDRRKISGKMFEITFQRIRKVLENN